jgi:ArsR family transcriptional regulator
MVRVLEETAVNNPALIKQPLARLQAMADRPAVQCP